MTKASGILLFATTALILAALPTFADTLAPTPTPTVVPADTKHKGDVTAIDTAANTITIAHKKLAPETFAITPSTRFTVNKTHATLADVKIGMRASITSADGKTADRIHATDQVAKGAKGGNKGAAIAGIPAQIA